MSKPAHVIWLCNSLNRCKARFETAAEKYRPLGALLVHRSELGNKSEPFWPDGYVNQGKHQLTGDGGGPRCTPRQLRDADGQSAAKYPGGQRSYRLYGDMFCGSSDADYSETLTEYFDNAAELGNLLGDLPGQNARRRQSLRPIRRCRGVPKMVPSCSRRNSCGSRQLAPKAT